MYRDACRWREMEKMLPSSPSADNMRKLMALAKGDKTMKTTEEIPKVTVLEAQ